MYITEKLKNKLLSPHYIKFNNNYKIKYDFKSQPFDKFIWDDDAVINEIKNQYLHDKNSIYSQINEHIKKILNDLGCNTNKLDEIENFIEENNITLKIQRIDEHTDIYDLYTVEKNGVPVESFCTKIEVCCKIKDGESYDKIN